MMRTLLLLLALASLPALAGDRGIRPPPPCHDRASCTGYVAPPVEQVPVDNPLALALLAAGVVGVAAWMRRK